MTDCHATAKPIMSNLRTSGIIMRERVANIWKGMKLEGREQMLETLLNVTLFTGSECMREYKVERKKCSQWYQMLLYFTLFMCSSIHRSHLHKCLEHWMHAGFQSNSHHSTQQSSHSMSRSLQTKTIKLSPSVCVRYVLQMERRANTGAQSPKCACVSNPALRKFHAVTHFYNSSEFPFYFLSWHC